MGAGTTGGDLTAVVVLAVLVLLTASVAVWLVVRLRRQSSATEARAREAERLRDQLGRRADVLEAANRCARALGSSLELDEAFDAFIREVRGFVPFDRIAIVLSEEGSAQVMAVAGVGAERVLPPGSARPIKGTLLEEILRQGQPVYRRDMLEPRYPEEERFRELGLRSRYVSPLFRAARTIGMLSLVRREADAFTDEEMELISLLGRLVASAVQNIRAYEAERRTVEELRRLSALRADFVSLVSHELRTPMAAVIGSARTLQQRWRELTPDQRESFLELIAGETSRLATLISDVLDTSRIDAGTFSFRFSDVDLGELVRDSVAAAGVSSDEVALHAEVHEPLPSVRGDPERLRQVLMNLLDNAIKYSPAGDEVQVRAYAENGRARVDVRDSGPGIAREDQRLIFEKFGRVTMGNTRPARASACSSPARSRRPTAGPWKSHQRQSVGRCSRSSCHCRPSCEETSCATQPLRGQFRDRRRSDQSSRGHGATVQRERYGALS